MLYFRTFFASSLALLLCPTSGICATTAVAPLQTHVAAPSSADAVGPFAYTFKSLYNFQGGTDGADSTAGLVDVGGILYGTTYGGGVAGCGGAGCGTVFAIKPSGKESVIYRFRGGTDGASPLAALTSVNGVLYGTTQVGGDLTCEFPSGCGTVFEISAAGAESVVYAFHGGDDGSYPAAGITAVNGTLYGTTEGGGRGNCSCGTVFAISPIGTENVVYSFQGGSDGAIPSRGDLRNVSGTLYGTTVAGGGTACHFNASNCGTIFAINPAGTESILYRFQGLPDGESPSGGLILENGLLYGTTMYGGGGTCSNNNLVGCGTVFEINSVGAETVLYRFLGGSIGSNPDSTLVDVNGTFYGTTPQSGNGLGYGNVFEMTKAGKVTVIHSFDVKDGESPEGRFLPANGTLYGTTSYGAKGFGNVFSLR